MDKDADREQPDDATKIHDEETSGSSEETENRCGERGEAFVDQEPSEDGERNVRGTEGHADEPDR